MEELERLPIPFIKGYTISSDGQIISDYTGRPLNPSISFNGYLDICLKKRKYFVHRLVAAVFLGLDINDPNIFVCHKNDIRTDNRKENLFLGTVQENNADAKSKGRAVNFGHAKHSFKKNGEAIGTSSLTETEVVQIKNALVAGSKILDLANQFNVDITTISKIKTGQTRAHIQVEGRDGRKKFPSVDIEKVKKLYQEGMSPLQISKLLGYTHERTCKIMKKHIPEYHNPLGRKLTDEDILQIKNKLLEGTNPTIIAQEFGMSASTIRRIKRGKLRGKVTGFKKDETKPAPKNMRAHREVVDIKKIIELYEQGKTNKEIESITGTNYGYVGTLLKRYVPGYNPVRSMSKLTDAQVKEIKTLISQKVFHSDIALKYGVGLRTIRAISRGESWKDITI